MPVQCLALKQDDTILYSGGSDNSIRAWKLGTPGQCIKVIDNLESSVLNMKLSLDETKLLMSCAKDVITYDP